MLGIVLGACGDDGSSTTPGPEQPVAAPGSGGAGGGGGAAAGPPSSSTGGQAAQPGPAAQFPCEVASILSTYCTKCHGARLTGGAPMPLVAPADFQLERNGQQVALTVMQRVRDPVRPMPMPPDPMLSQAEIATLDGWVAGGAMPVATGCDVQDPTLTAPDPTAGTAAPPVMAPDAGSVVEPPPSGGALEGPRWASFGYDLANSRSNPDETELGPSNIASLQRLWEVAVPGSTSTPAVAGGVVYLPAWDSKVYALRTEDGAQLWATQLPDLIDSSPAVTADRVFVSDDAGSVHALERESGNVLWSSRVDPHPETHLWSSPVYIEDAALIVIGLASSDEVLPAGTQTFRGGVVGLDADTGDERWRFDTTSGGESGAGIGVWGTAAVDTDRKLAFLGTGNNYTAPTGIYADSLLAIDYETGALVWSYQFTADDVFTVGAFPAGPDFDVGSSANLFSAGGKDLVGVGVKSGFYYAFERETGAFEWSTEITPGSVLGGVMSASAYHDGLVFVASNLSLGGNTRTVALRADSGEIAWSHEALLPTYGGLAHANGVVYLGTTGAMIYALDALSGQELWSDATADAIAGSPSVADGMLFVPWGYQWTLRDGQPGTGGLIAYGL